MQNTDKTYVAIDLKSFYASVECVERDLDPLTTNLVVADKSRTEKTICLAVSPSLKSYGISGRARLFEVVQRIKEVNYERKRGTGRYRMAGKSVSDIELKANPYLEVDYIVAPPRMAYYIKYSTYIYKIYLKYVAPEDIHVYSVDEVFMDVTAYLHTYGLTARELTRKIIGDVLQQTGITATAGIGTNLYLCKVAMDIEAKHIPADESGVRIAELDEQSYRRKLWTHRPLKDFWRVGSGIAGKLAQYGIYTMGDIAKQSVMNEELLYQLFGVNAELLIDHAWGWEPCTLEAIKSYKPSTNSFSSGQVLQEPYTAKKARVVVREMAESAALNLLDKGMVTDQLVLTIGYDVINLSNNETGGIKYFGEVTTDRYGRKVPKHAHGTANLDNHTSSAKQISDAVMELFDRIVNPNLLVRRINLTTNNVIDESVAVNNDVSVQFDLFTDYEAVENEMRIEKDKLEKERKVQSAVLKIKKQFGKNAILKGFNYEEGATAKERNRQIGGHKA